VPSPKNIEGKRFGRFIAICPTKSSSQGRYWLCKCDCGIQKEVQAKCLIAGAIQSCGCLFRENVKTYSRTHGQSGTSTHNIWMNMIWRCTNQNAPRFADYGGRGITVCKRWMNFKLFVEDMGHRPAGMSLDRINNNGNYEPSNCRWASRVAQANNAPSNKKIHFRGETFGEAEWARRIGIKRTTLQYRLRSGWTVGQALGFESRANIERYLCKSKK
jgi:hypothetical protein